MSDSIPGFLEVVLVSMLIGGAFGMLMADHDRSGMMSTIGGIMVGAIVGVPAAIAIRGVHLAQVERHRSDMTSEIGADEYRVVSLWRRTDCRLDAQAGRALVDGSIARNEYERMSQMAERIRKESARAEAGGASPSRTCSVVPKR
jgi:hypothetical protein